jgi:molecular chaperone GrpE (heat shock protein)
MQSSNKDASQANVVQNFLIVWDELIELKNQDLSSSSSSSFGVKYHGLVDSMASTLRELGVQSYDATVGELLDPVRVTIVDREFSDLYPPNTILHSSQPGLELRGNVLRLAQAIVSKGPEAALEAEKESSLIDSEDDSV